MPPVLLCELKEHLIQALILELQKDKARSCLIDKKENPAKNNYWKDEFRSKTALCSKFQPRQPCSTNLQNFEQEISTLFLFWKANKNEAKLTAMIKPEMSPVRQRTQFNSTVQPQSSQCAEDV